MVEQPLMVLLLLVGVAVAVSLIFQRLHLPASLGYLLVGVLLGPHTGGPVIDERQIAVLAEFGIVFLLFTIGLSFSLSQIYALRHVVLGLGTAQVILTTVVVGLVAFGLGLPPAAAFVVGAVFAQSSTTIISKQLAEQSEEHTRPGRLGIAMSVFQDVTAVPFVVVIPVLGVAAAQSLADSLLLALGKAVLAFTVVFLAGRWLLRPMFHFVAERKSAELFTLAVLFVSLAAAWATSSLGLSMAFGAFLVGMMLGETEFRHQVEATIRPFRDVLLGLFFVSIGMLFDPAVIPQIWQPALASSAALLSIKMMLVALILRLAGFDRRTAVRIGLLLAVGGEFGFALLAIALDAGVLPPDIAQIVLVAVLFSMIAASFFIRYNDFLTAGLATSEPASIVDVKETLAQDSNALMDHVIVCGFGRIGQSVGRFLEIEKIPYIALDLDATRVREARIAGQSVHYADSSDRAVLEAVGLENARLVVISYNDISSAIKTLHSIRYLRPELPVMVRASDESEVEELRQAGATEVVPESLEVAIMIVSHVLFLLDIPIRRVVRCIREQRTDRYRLLREFFRGGEPFIDETAESGEDRLRPVILTEGSRGIGRRLQGLGLDGVVVTALVRRGVRTLSPSPDTVLEPEDVVVLFGSTEDLEKAENQLLG